MRALVGISNNISNNINKIKVWAHSYKKFAKDKDVVLIALNPSNEDKQLLEDNDIQYYEVVQTNTISVNDARLPIISNYLKQCEYHVVLLTDVFDVCFQDDPLRLLNFTENDIYVGSEGVLHREEPWNSDVMTKCFPQEVEELKDKEVLCSGVIAGKTDKVIELYDKMWDKIQTAIDGHDIKDQCVMNIIIHKNEIDRIGIKTLNQGWVCHLATSGPTSFLDAWGFGNILKERYNLPKMVDRFVYTSQDIEFDIVHQFNRIPEWNEKIIKPYI